jgi:hypothetical protein
MNKTGCSERLVNSLSKLAAKAAALLLIFVLSAISAAAQQKQHQATGTVATSAPTQLTILKKFGRNKARWNFAVTPKTKVDGRLLPTVRVRVYYHEDKGQKVADRVKIMGLGASAASKPKVSRMFALRDPEHIC